MNKVSDLLKAAKAVITDPDKWTKGHIARDAEGQPVSASSSDAICWCSIGAYYRVLPNNAVDTPLDYDAFSILSLAATQLDDEGCGIAYFNDSRNHDEVMKMWDKAIELAAAEESKVAVATLR